MKTDELRESFLEFFESKGCVRRPSDVLIPKDDPTVLFTPAGMNQFKQQFLGVGNLEFTRAATCQKCLRTGDISNVGVTAYHHTFFEMLGNFSFGDYFKKDAIRWAWEYLTERKWLNLDAERLTVTVYTDDDEAYDIWHKEVGLPIDRIRRDNEDENFWPAGAPSHGPDGVCGPCSEIFYHPASGGSEVEIWNLVFTQFNRKGDPPENLVPLPKKNIDTGMGLERTAAVLQGVESNFEIDIFKPLCLATAEVLGRQYDFSSSEGRPIRRISDHVRAITFCIHEGVHPGSEKESYVVRQLLRRASLEGFLLGKQEPFLYELVPAVVEAMKHAYPEIAQTMESVARTIEEDEEQFLSVIDHGLSRFEKCVQNAKMSGSSFISGEDAFNLHQTDGFLIELTEAMAARRNLSVDRDRFDELMQQHKTESGRGAFADSVMAEGPLDAIRKTQGSTEFLGYESTEANAKVVGIVAEKQLVEKVTEVGHEHQIVVLLDHSPFYGEAGGQVGDCGTLVGDGFEFQVLDTQRDGKLLLHIGRLTLGTLEIGVRVAATVLSERRAGIRRAHSATHLLHHALRKTLGSNATQRGSKVEQDSFRFDFSHKGSLKKEELYEIEDEINRCIAEGSVVKTQVMPLEEAKKLGAMALFGEKYPDIVRVVTMGDYSVEFCGGTHLENTGQVGLCQIVSEEPVAKGVRRMTAITGPEALKEIRANGEVLAELKSVLKVQHSNELPKRAQSLWNELKQAQKAVADLATESVAENVEKLLSAAVIVAGVKIVAAAPDGADRELLRNYIDRLRGKESSIAILLGCVEDGKVGLTAAVSKDLIERSVKASDCIAISAKIVGGGGGGRPDMAEAGGRLPEKLPEALEAGLNFYKKKIER